MSLFSLFSDVQDFNMDRQEKIPPEVGLRKNIDSWYKFKDHRSTAWRYHGVLCFDTWIWVASVSETHMVPIP